MILYRPMVDGDIAAGLSLCRSAGWNQTAEDWQLFLLLSPQGCCVAVDDDGEVRGTVATVRYEDHFSWIGMVLVDPGHQRQGIGIQLLRESLQILSNEDTVKLDATPAGRHIYLQLDFVDEYSISRMEASEAPAVDIQGFQVRLVREEDLPSLLEFDRKVFGADREPVIRSVFQRSPRLAFLSERNGRIEGYCFGRTGHKFTHIGPVVGSDFQSARAVVAAAFQNVGGRPLVIDSPHHSPEWMQWLTSTGFREQRPLIRMYRGTNAHPGIPSKQFAILGPEFG
jgi:GNAT superfamily N-acetyltransferase